MQWLHHYSIGRIFVDMEDLSVLNMKSECVDEIVIDYIIITDSKIGVSQIGSAAGEFDGPL